MLDENILILEDRGLIFRFLWMVVVHMFQDALEIEQRIRLCKTSNVLRWNTAVAPQT